MVYCCLLYIEKHRSGIIISVVLNFAFLLFLIRPPFPEQYKQSKGKVTKVHSDCHYSDYWNHQNCFATIILLADRVIINYTCSWFPSRLSYGVNNVNEGEYLHFTFEHPKLTLTWRRTFQCTITTHCIVWWSHYRIDILNVTVTSSLFFCYNNNNNGLWCGAASDRTAREKEHIIFFSSTL